MARKALPGAKSASYISALRRTAGRTLQNLLRTFGAVCDFGFGFFQPTPVQKAAFATARSMYLEKVERRQLFAASAAVSGGVLTITNDSQVKIVVDASTANIVANIGTFTKTRVFSTGQVCSGPDCDGFSYITCKK